jgi:hypothetical protein
MNRLTWAIRRAGRDRHLEHAERRRHERVIANEAGQVDHPALAKVMPDLFEQAVVDGMVAMARGRHGKSL